METGERKFAKKLTLVRSVRRLMAAVDINYTQGI
ncbi:MAG: hypothetical protein MAG581_00251 [Deltaproteobacteria bacterium]|nr:hypothetical protein [Deltaproteobacteria bacterium]